MEGKRQDLTPQTRNAITSVNLIRLWPSASEHSRRNQGREGQVLP
jgi:hypothetical protein